MAAGDTFRAAAAEQLGMWAERAGAELVRGNEGGDPSAVIFDAVEAAAARGADLVLADTAGRLHTKVNLMEELRKVRRVADKGAGHVTEVLLVLDATTGQNGLVQAQQFTEAVELTGVVLTKLDGSAKGGIVIAIHDQLGIPVKLVGLGEGADDLVAVRPRRVRGGTVLMRLMTFPCQAPGPAACVLPIKVVLATAGSRSAPASRPAPCRSRARGRGPLARAQGRGAVRRGRGPRRLRRASSWARPAPSWPRRLAAGSFGRRRHRTEPGGGPRRGHHRGRGDRRRRDRDRDRHHHRGARRGRRGRRRRRGRARSWPTRSRPRSTRPSASPAASWASTSDDADEAR